MANSVSRNIALFAKLWLRNIILFLLWWTSNLDSVFWEEKQLQLA